jgi:trehalose-6-phosphate synthase
MRACARFFCPLPAVRCVRGVQMRQEQFYGGYCRTILWPLLHYSLPTTEDMVS